MSNLDKTISIIVENSDALLFEGQAKAVTCINEKGQFDILPYHANFISLIKEKVVVQTEKGESQVFKIGNGVLRVIENKVNIYVGLN